MFNYDLRDVSHTIDFNNFVDEIVDGLLETYSYEELTVPSYVILQELALDHYLNENIEAAKEIIIQNILPIDKEG